jgi:uncharacterized protein with GYD domain
MAEKKDKEQPEIKITDKRKFDSKGNLKDPEAAKADDEKAAEERKTLSEEAKRVEEALESETSEGVTFSKFILTLGTQAMVYLGLASDPFEGKVKVDIKHAKQMIDIIAMLRKKAQGNLEADEITLVDNMLFELRMKYVELREKK